MYYAYFLYAFLAVEGAELMREFGKEVVIEKEAEAHQQLRVNERAFINLVDVVAVAMELSGEPNRAYAFLFDHFLDAFPDV